MKMYYKKTAQAIVLLASLLVLLPAVQAIAIAPATIELAPGTQQEIELHIINNEQKTTEILLYKKGGLASYFDLPAETITLSPNQIRIMKIRINLLPESAAGKSARIGAKENPKAGQIGAVAAVESIVTVSGTGAEKDSAAPAAVKEDVALLGISIKKSGDAGTLEISVANRGNADTEVYAEAKIDADTGTANIKTGSELVPAGKEETLTAELDSVLAKAKDYRIDAVVYFGKNSVKKTVRVSSGITGSAAVDVPAGTTNTDFLLIVAIIFVITLDAAVFIWRKLRLY